jgi:hypothetical protein
MRSAVTWLFSQRKDRAVDFVLPGLKGFGCRVCQHRHQDKYRRKGEDVEIEIPFLKGYTVFCAGADRQFARLLTKIEFLLNMRAA